MTITSIVTSSNEHDRWSAQFPVIDEAKCFPVNPRSGKPTANARECYLALAKEPRYVKGADHRNEYLNQLVCSWIRLVNEWKDEAHISSERGATGVERTMKRINRRIDSGHSTRVICKWYPRVDSTCLPAASLRIELDNGGVVQPREYERIFAWKLAEAAQCVNEDLHDRKLPEIYLDASVTALLGELAAWKAERAAERRIEELNAKRVNCPNRHGDYCSPCQFDCPCYRGGRCVECKDVLG